jgi:large subunit ribosomal protein L15
VTTQTQKSKRREEEDSIVNNCLLLSQLISLIKRSLLGGDWHGNGQKRWTVLRLGYDCSNSPFYLRFKYEPYYQGHHLKRQYPPITLKTLQLLIDTDRLDTSRPIDVASLCTTGLHQILPDQKQFGFQLTDEGADCFKAKINIEVQHASELVIAAVEKNGGVIRTAYYDQHALHVLKDPKKFFERGLPIPRRMIPPQDAIEYYTNPKNRGYLADPEAVSHERLVLAQKYGYKLPKIEEDPHFNMLVETKDPRQIFYGLDPDIVVNLRDKCFIKPKTDG